MSVTMPLTHEACCQEQRLQPVELARITEEDLSDLLQQAMEMTGQVRRLRNTVECLILRNMFGDPPDRGDAEGAEGTNVSDADQ